MKIMYLDLNKNNNLLKIYYKKLKFTLCIFHNFSLAFQNNIIIK